MISLITPQAVVAISKVRNRNEVLKRLVPKIFGVIGERGQRLEEFPGCSARIDGELILMGSQLGPDRIVLSVYWTLKSQLTKVFSAHVYGGLENGRVGLMSWRRGAWEDAVMADAATPLSLSEMFKRGVFRTENQLLH
jgi:hypothetical protein